MKVSSQGAKSLEWWYPHFTGSDWGVGSSQAASYLCVRTPADAGFPNGRVFVLKEFCRPDSDMDEYPAEFLRRFVIPNLHCVFPLKITFALRIWVLGWRRFA
jgi:hypothetical protein